MKVHELIQALQALEIEKQNFDVVISDDEWGCYQPVEGFMFFKSYLNYDDGEFYRSYSPEKDKLDKLENTLCLF